MPSFRSLTRLAVLMAVLWLCGAAYGSVLAEFDETVDFEDATGAQTSMPPQKVDYTKATHGSSVTFWAERRSFTAVRCNTARTRAMGGGPSK
jgi:hypothetical protein